MSRRYGDGNGLELFQLVYLRICQILGIEVSRQAGDQLVCQQLDDWECCCKI